MESFDEGLVVGLILNNNINESTRSKIIKSLQSIGQTIASNASWDNISCIIESLYVSGLMVRTPAQSIVYSNLELLNRINNITQAVDIAFIDAVAGSQVENISFIDTISSSSITTSTNITFG